MSVSPVREGQHYRPSSVEAKLQPKLQARRRQAHENIHTCMREASPVKLAAIAERVMILKSVQIFVLSLTH
eukprot:7875386-Pyramimonas_sp.AAC.1